MKNNLIVGIVVFVSLIILGVYFYPQQEEYCYLREKEGLSIPEGVELGLSLSEAKEIAVNSECGDRLKETYMCNEDTGSWWIDLDIEREGCNPACVVYAVSKEAEINWRCTGLIEP